MLVSLDFCSHGTYPPAGGKFAETPLLCGYEPVIIAARDGQQIANGVTIWLNVTPRVCSSDRAFFITARSASV